MLPTERNPDVPPDLEHDHRHRAREGRRATATRPPTTCAPTSCASAAAAPSSARPSTALVVDHPTPGATAAVRTSPPRPPRPTAPTVATPARRRARPHAPGHARCRARSRNTALVWIAHAPRARGGRRRDPLRRDQARWHRRQPSRVPNVVTKKVDVAQQELENAHLRPDVRRDHRPDRAGRHRRAPGPRRGHERDARLDRHAVRQQRLRRRSTIPFDITTGKTADDVTNRAEGARLRRRTRRTQANAAPEGHRLRQHPEARHQRRRSVRRSRSSCRRVPNRSRSRR